MNLKQIFADEHKSIGDTVFESGHYFNNHKEYLDQVESALSNPKCFDETKINHELFDSKTTTREQYLVSLINKNFSGRYDAQTMEAILTKKIHPDEMETLSDVSIGEVPQVEEQEKVS